MNNDVKTNTLYKKKELEEISDENKHYTFDCSIDNNKVLVLNNRIKYCNGIWKYYKNLHIIFMLLSEQSINFIENRLKVFKNIKNNLEGGSNITIYDSFYKNVRGSVNNKSTIELDKKNTTENKISNTHIDLIEDEMKNIGKLNDEYNIFHKNFKHFDLKILINKFENYNMINIIKQFFNTFLPNYNNRVTDTDKLVLDLKSQQEIQKKLKEITMKNETQFEKNITSKKLKQTIKGGSIFNTSNISVTNSLKENIKGNDSNKSFSLDFDDLKKDCNANSIYNFEKKEKIGEFLEVCDDLIQTHIPIKKKEFTDLKFILDPLIIIPTCSDEENISIYLRDLIFIFKDISFEFIKKQDCTIVVFQPSKDTSIINIHKIIKEQEERLKILKQMNKLNIPLGM